MALSTKDQKKVIHTLKHALKLSRDEYEVMLETYGVTSSVNLTESEAQGLIKQLRKLANNLKYDEFTGRQGMANPAQLRKIDALWRSVSFGRTYKAKTLGLKTFLRTRFDVANMGAVTAFKVTPIITAIKAMAEKQTKEIA